MCQQGKKPLPTLGLQNIWRVARLLNYLCSWQDKWMNDFVSVVLKILGKYQKLIVQWPCILSLVFLLGRFIYILVKAVRIHLQVEQEVSMWELIKTVLTVRFPFGQNYVNNKWVSCCIHEENPNNHSVASYSAYVNRIRLFNTINCVWLIESAARILQSW